MLARKLLVPTPTVPANVNVPLPLFTASVYAVVGEPSVLTKLTFEFVVFSVVFAPSVTAPVYVCTPLVVTAPPLIAVVPATLTLARGAAPTIPSNSAFAVATAKVYPPFSVLLNHTNDPDPPVKVVAAPNVTAPV
jgi:hypothetical protein